MPVRNARKSNLTAAGKFSDITVIIVNPNSCSGLTGKNWDSLYSSIKQVLGENVKVVLSKKPGDGTTIARKHLKRGVKRLVAIGGDGTLNEVANGFFEEPAGIFGKMGDRHNSEGRANGPIPTNDDDPSLTLTPINPDAVMAVVPCGTRNVLAKSLGLPQGVVECCQVFSAGKPTKTDVIVTSVTDPKDGSLSPPRVVLNAAEIGLGAEIIDRSKKVRKAVKSRLLSTVAGIIATVPTYQSNVCEISIVGGKDGSSKSRRKNTIHTIMTMAVISNGKFLGGGFLAAPKANMADGFLDIVVLKESSSLTVLDELVNMKEGNYQNDDKILYTQAKKVSIKSKERDVTVTVDGEPIGILPAKFEILHNGLNIKM